jgi:predicted dehydrogenase
VNNDGKLRAAVIGCGFIGCGQALNADEVGVFSHAEAYIASDQTTLVALCDEAESRLANLPNRYCRIPTCTSIADCLETHRPDIVSIATPDQTHFEIAMQIIAFPSVRGVLLEKPIALSSSEARKVVQAAARENVTLAVNYSRRYAKRFQFIAEQVKAGALGEFQSILGLYTKGIVHNGSHWIDLLDFFGFQIKKVKAHLKNPNMQVDPTPSVAFELDGCTAYLAGCDEKCFTVFEMDIVGTLGRVRICDGGFRVEWSMARPSERFSDYTVLGSKGGGQDGGMKDAMLHAVNDLAQSIVCGRDPLSTGETALASIEICEAILHSLNTHSTAVYPCAFVP